MGNVTKVEYYNGAVKIGERTSEPFEQFTWLGADTPDDSTANLTAKVYIDTGAVITTSNVSININAVNQPPTGTPDTYTATQDQMLSIPVESGVLANDSDPEGDTLTAELVTTTSNGTLTLNSDGSFDYTPNTSYVGADSFVYRVFDDSDYSANVTVDITVEEAAADWAQVVVDDYETRVNNDLGNVEDKAQLKLDLEAGSEQDYLDAIAIYNPNGGHQTEKIYDVRDTTRNHHNLIYNTRNLVDTYTGGGTKEWTTEETNPLSSEPVAKFTGGGTSQGAAVSPTMYTVNNFMSVIAKAGTATYLYMSTGSTSSKKHVFNLVDGTVDNTAYEAGIEDLGNGWFRCYAADGNSGSEGTLQLGVNNSSTGYDMNNSGKFLYISGINIDTTDTLQGYSRVPKLDLTVTGGGGTRILADGSIEDIGYYNFVPNSNDVTQWSGRCPKSQNGNESLVTEDTETGMHIAYNKIVNYEPNTRTHSAEIKKVNHRYAVVGAGINYYVIYDFDTDTITYESWNGFTISTVVKEDGWVKINIYFNNPSASYLYVTIGPALDATTASYTGEGYRAVLFRKPMAIYSPSGLSEAPYQVNTGSPAFPKIDYSTGKSAFLIEPQRTNYKEAITSTTGQSNSTIYQDVPNIIGEENKGMRLEDTSASSAGNISEVYYNIPSTKYLRFSFWFKKQPTNDIYSAIAVNNGGNNEDLNKVLFDPKTGTSMWDVHDGIAIKSVIDRGDYWELVIIRGDGVYDITSYFFVFQPAIGYNNNMPVRSNGAKGEVEIGYIGITDSSFIDETPIITNGTAITRTRNYYEGIVDIPASFSLFIHAEKVDDDIVTMLVDGVSYLNTHYRLKASGGNLTWNIRYEDSYRVTESTPLATNAEFKVILITTPTGTKWYLNGSLVSVADGANNGANFFNKIGLGGISNYDGSGTVYECKILPEITDQEAIDLTTL